MAYYVCEGAKLKCSMGDSPSDLGVIQTGNLVYIQNKFQATIADHKPIINIRPFGQCRSLANPSVASATAVNWGVLRPMPCVPNTNMVWLDGKMNVFVKGQPALMDNSTLFCTWGGTIEITDPGQSLVQTGAKRATPIEDPEVASVTGAETVSVGEKITYRVNRYNIDEVEEGDKENIKWAVIVDGAQKDIPFQYGETIELEMKEEWLGKEITVMARCFFGEFNEKVCQKTKIEGGSMNITDVYWIDEEGNKNRELETDTPITLTLELEDFTSGTEFEFYFENQDNDGSNRTYSGTINKDGIVEIENFQLKLNKQ
jgi:hypothetical protein